MNIKYIHILAGWKPSFSRWRCETIRKKPHGWTSSLLESAWPLLLPYDLTCSACWPTEPVLFAWQNSTILLNMQHLSWPVTWRGYYLCRAHLLTSIFWPQCDLLMPSDDKMPPHSLNNRLYLRVVCAAFILHNVCINRQMYRSSTYQL